MEFIFLIGLFGFWISVVYSIYSFKKKRHFFILSLWCISLFSGLFLLSIGVNTLSMLILITTSIGIWFNPVVVQRRNDKERKSIEQLANIKREASNFPIIDEKEQVAKTTKTDEINITPNPKTQVINKPKFQQDDKALLFHSGVFCPSCRSLDVTFMQNNRKGFSVSKAVGGTILTGGIGSLAGFAGKKGKNQWFCNCCNRTFTSKK